MKGIVGFVIFIALSLAVHAGALLSLPEGGAQGRGSGGDDTLALAAASEVLTAMVEQWETAPLAAPQPVMILPVTSEIAPVLTPDTLVEPQAPTHLMPATPDTLPHISMPAPALPNPGAAISVLPSLQAPVLPGGIAQPPTATDARPSRITPRLAAPDALAPAQPDIRPHFEGSTNLAIDASPRPTSRPDDLAPIPRAAETSPRQHPQQPQQPRPQAPAPDRIAAGSGGGETQGAAPQPVAQPAMSTAQIESAMAQWGGQIQSRIARSRPNVAGAGRAVVQLRVGRNGELQGLGLAQSSGNGAVDQAALSTVQRAGRFPRAPSSLTDAAYSFSIAVSFQ